MSIVAPAARMAGHASPVDVVAATLADVGGQIWELQNGPVDPEPGELEAPSGEGRRGRGSARRWEDDG